MPELVIPSGRYKESFLSALHGYQEEHWERYVSLDPEMLRTDFDTFIRQIRDESLGENLPDGYVPHTEYWLVEGDKFLGRLDIRHTLNEWLQTIGGHIGYDIRTDERGKGYGHLILELGLLKAKELGFSRVLLTCDDTNVRSIKVMERHGGVRDSDTIQGNGKPNKRRYWITL